MGEVESLAKGRAIHRPDGWIASYRSKVQHLVEGKLSPSEYVAFDVLLHIVGWDPRRSDYGKIERNISRLQREWFPFWTRPQVIKLLKSLESKLYIEDDGEFLAIPNFSKYQDTKNRKGVTPVTVSPQLQGGVTTVTESVTVVTPNGSQTRTTSKSPESKQITNIYSNSSRYFECFEVLRGVKGYPLDPKTDEAHLEQLEQEFPKVDLLLVVKKWASAKLDDPLNKSSRPRAQIRTWVTNASTWGRDLKQETVSPSEPQYAPLQPRRRHEPSGSDSGPGQHPGRGLQDHEIQKLSGW